MDELAAHRVALLILDHRRDRVRALDLDVDQGAAVDEHVAQVALADLERARLRAGAVDDAGDEARRGAGGGSRANRTRFAAGP